MIGIIVIIMKDKNLEIIYNQIVNSNSQEFFIYVNDFINYIFSELKFKSIVNNIKEEEEEDVKKLEAAKKKLLQVCIKVYEGFKNKKLKSKQFHKWDFSKINKNSYNLIDTEKLSDMLSLYSINLKKLTKDQIKLNEKLHEEIEIFQSAKHNHKINVIFSTWNSLKELSSIQNLKINLNDLSDDGYAELFEGTNLKLEILDYVENKKQLSKKTKDKYLKHVNRVYYYLEKNSNKIKYSYKSDFTFRYKYFKKLSKKRKLWNFLKYFQKKYCLFQWLILLLLLYLCHISFLR